MKAFTLIEILVTLTLVGVIGSVTLWWSMSLDRGGSLSEETERLARTLMRARTGALTSGTAFGVCLQEPRTYRLYGAEIDEAHTLPEGIIISGLSPCDEGIEFAALSARTTPATITLTEGERVRSIEVNGEGRIVW